MNPILDALRTALTSYQEEIALNEREAAAAHEYLHTLDKRHVYLEGQIAEIAAAIATRKEETSATAP